MKRTQRALIAPLLLASASVAPAASILIDFGKPGDGLVSTGNWNNFDRADGSSGFRFQNQSANYRLFGGSNPAVPNLLDSEGNETSVGLVWVGVEGGYSAGVAGSEYDSPTSTSYPITATRDFLFFNDGAGNTKNQREATLRLDGLVANGLYNLTFFAGTPVAGGANSDYADTSWSSDGQTVSVDPNGNTQTVTLIGLQANDLGVLEFTWSNASSFDASQSDTAIWNTLEITAIPEPSSTALVGAALAFGCFTRRRR